MTPLFPESDDRARLERLAREHAERSAGPDGRAPSCAPIERLVVDYLRHLCSDGGTDQGPEPHRQVCEAIAARYPWLAAECRRQVVVRAAEEARDRFHQRSESWERGDRRREHRELVARSREVIGRLRVGQRVGFRYRRFWYTGVIVGLGRTRARVAHRVFTGPERVRMLHAAKLVPFDERTFGDGPR
ncbi:hypothetical protein [Nocardiopsis kunsanensis]|uniref:Uncharacterized protein n=1 Tax=Nocardiopsis kunsanensis TaxID=141693 RepID=A0A918XA20_9ACTN|nr:hypothetical protein [Nocardiopsis kunsanensis]GHD20703.1 hypothetical protein GCM10007147_13430 [Nocardiopsis kunsanensis]